MSDDKNAITTLHPAGESRGVRACEECGASGKDLYTRLYYATPEILAHNNAKKTSIAIPGISMDCAWLCYQCSPDSGDVAFYHLCTPMPDMARSNGQERPVVNGLAVNDDVIGQQNVAAYKNKYHGWLPVQYSYTRPNS
jgi:hypothetical protein